MEERKRADILVGIRGFVRELEEEVVEHNWLRPIELYHAYIAR